MAKQQNISEAEVEKQFFETIRPTFLLKRFESTEEVASVVAFVAAFLALLFQCRCRRGRYGTGEGRRRPNHPWPLAGPRRLWRSMGLRCAQKAIMAPLSSAPNSNQIKYCHGLLLITYLFRMHARYRM
jgi:hypothetical protein